MCGKNEESMDCEGCFWHADPVRERGKSELRYTHFARAFENLCGDSCHFPGCMGKIICGDEAQISPDGLRDDTRMPQGRTATRTHDNNLPGEQEMDKR